MDSALGNPACAGRQRSLLWLLVFGVCTAVALVPSPLLEFRYFIVPFILLLLNSDESTLTTRWSLVIVLGNVIMHVVVVSVFLFRPFVWADGSVARFMW